VSTPNPGYQCTNNNDCTGGLVCIAQTCQACTDTRQCSGNQVCLNGTCQTPGPGPGPVCPALCPPCQVCNSATGQCEVCPANCNVCVLLADRTSKCGNATFPLSGVPCTTSADCPEGRKDCVRTVTNLSTNEIANVCTDTQRPCCFGVQPCF
jgi:hypothetical protein